MRRCIDALGSLLDLYVGCPNKTISSEIAKRGGNGRLVWNRENQYISRRLVARGVSRKWLKDFPKKRDIGKQSDTSHLEVSLPANLQSVAERSRSGNKKLRPNEKINEDNGRKPP